MVNPQMGCLGWGSALKPVVMEDALPRHGLAYLAASLKQSGHRVGLADLRFLSGWEQYREILETWRPEVVCVTAHTMEMNDALQCFRLAKQASPEIMTIGGGIHMTMQPQQALASGAVDYVMKGEGEISLPQLIAAPGEFEAESWGQPPDLDQIPFEYREIYPDYKLRIRFPIWDLPTPIVDILTKRGCPWRCRFCCGPGEQNLYSKPSPQDNEKRLPNLRSRSVENVMAELEELRAKYRFRSIIFHDDQFLLDPGWVMDFCRALHRRGFVKGGLKWWAASRADLVCKYPEVIKTMHEAGLAILSIGFESFSDDMLAWLGKGVDRATNLKAAEICRGMGLNIYANVMFGVLNRQARWDFGDDLVNLEAVRTIRPKYFSPSFFSPIPGSWFYDWALDKGLISGRELDTMGNRRTNQVKLPGVDYQTLGAAVAKVSRKFATPLGDRLRYYRFRISTINQHTSLPEL